MLSSLLELLSDITGFEHGVCQVLAILSMVFGMLLFVLLAVEEANSWRAEARVSDSNPTATTPSGGIFGRQKKAAVRERLLIVGPVSSGKTSLYYRLLSGDMRETVSSVDLNQTRDKVSVKVPLEILPGGSDRTPEGEEKETFEEFSIALTDIPGHYNFRSEITQKLPSAKAIVIILDSKDKAKYGEAAEILYDVLGDIDIISDEVPILVACNKQDLAFAKNALKMERDLTTEIEQIRKVRMATRQQELDTANRDAHLEEEEDERQEPGYLETLKGKFGFDKLPNKVQFSDCCVKDGILDEVLKFIANHF